MRLLPSGSGWLRAKRSSKIVAFSKIVVVDLDIAKAGARRRERGLGEAGVGEACYLLRRGGEDVRGDVAEVPELGVVDRHGLLVAQAAKRLAVLLGEPAALLGALTVGAGETAREIWTLGRRRHHLRGSSPLRARGSTTTKADNMSCHEGHAHQ